jgi:hypothetical protein
MMLITGPASGRRSRHGQCGRDGLLKDLAEEIKSGPASNCHQRVHLLGRPARIRLALPTGVTEELVDALADRLISRLMSGIDEALVRRILQK